VYEIINRPSGTRTFGPSGELIYYSINLNQGNMRIWNSSWAYMEGRTGMAMAWNVLRSTIDASERGWQEDIPIPTGLSGSVRSVDFVDTQRVVGTRTAANYSEVDVWAFSLEPGKEGQLLYSRSATNPEVWADGASFSNGPLSVDDGVFTIWSPELRQWWGYSLETGKMIWGPTEPEHYLNLYSKNHQTKYGILYSTGCSGELKAYDIKTGELLWDYHNADPYSEFLFNKDWWLRINFITDGKIYLSHEEHSPIDPLPRGAPFVCLDAITGELIWRADGLFRGTHWGGRAIIGESIILTQDTYDQQTYAVGKGPSSTTVTASPKVSVHGSNVLVEGVVTDVSPGTKNDRITLRFPKGVPAVADESMSEWMTYVYKNFPRPDAVGVEVVVSVLDPNNNYYEVGRTTADADGAFGYAFEPEVPGTYRIIATFEGSRSYYGSHATTYVNVEEAPAAAPEPTPPPESVADVFFVPAVAGIIIAIAIVGAIVLIALRKR
jgi:outer membrane protein assembly factor BamB